MDFSWAEDYLPNCVERTPPLAQVPTPVLARRFPRSTSGDRSALVLRREVVRCSVPLVPQCWVSDRRSGSRSSDGREPGVWRHCFHRTSRLLGVVTHVSTTTQVYAHSDWLRRHEPIEFLREARMARTTCLTQPQLTGLDG